MRHNKEPERARDKNMELIIESWIESFDQISEKAICSEGNDRIEWQQGNNIEQYGRTKVKGNFRLREVSFLNVETTSAGTPS